MADFILSPEMSMPIPVVGVDPGPDWADNLNTALSILDSHDHSPGKGVPITPSGISITSDLSFLGYNAVALRSSRYTPQASPLGLATDLGCVYVSGVDLYFNDVNGNQVRITQSGGVAGSPGSISNLTSPASAAYVAGTTTFVWESDAATSANMDCGSVIIREVLANAKGITLASPAALAADYQLTFPGALPASTTFLGVDSSGNISAPVSVVDNSTLQQSGLMLSMKDAGTTRAKLAAAGQVLSSSTGTFSTTSTSFVDVTNATSGALDVTGRPVKIMLIPDGGGTEAFFGFAGGSNQGFIMKLLRDSTVVGIFKASPGISVTDTFFLPPASCSFVDVPAAGTYTYKLQVKSVTGTTVYVQRCKLYVQEDY